jgi:hypothetical protein
VTRRPGHRSTSDTSLYQKSLACLRQSDSDRRTLQRSKPLEPQRRSAALLSCSTVPSDNPTLLPIHTLPRTWDGCAARIVRECSSACLPASRFLVSLPSCHYDDHRVRALLLACERETSTLPSSLPLCLPPTQPPPLTTLNIATPWNCPLAALRHASSHIPGSVLPTSSVAIFQRIFQRARPVL